MKIKLATWNINSVRLRLPQVLKFLDEQKPDILGLQEIKCQEEQFPFEPFREAGYEFIEVAGQKGYHGAATLSREKFQHKLDFLQAMHDYFAARFEKGDDQQVLVGDFNIAPHEHDVWGHKQLLKVVSHTPLEVGILENLRKTHEFIDTSRLFRSEEEKLYSWWSYRARDVMASNRGRRLDHIWVSPALKPAVDVMGRDGHEIHVPCRIWEKPSDHVPMTQIIDLNA